MRLAALFIPITLLLSTLNTMPSSTVTIHASGSHTVKRTPELVDLNLRIHDEGADAASALNAVRQASAEISSHIRQLAPPKGEVKNAAIDSEELDVDDEKLDPQFPVTSWSMQQLRTWSVVPPRDDDRPRPQHRTMMATAQTEEKKPEKVYHAETYVRATFHDFAALGEAIDKLTVSRLLLGVRGTGSMHAWVHTETATRMLGICKRPLPTAHD